MALRLCAVPLPSYLLAIPLPMHPVNSFMRIYVNAVTLALVRVWNRQRKKIKKHVRLDRRRATTVQLQHIIVVEPV
jgi:hypothetical protein